MEQRETNKFDSVILAGGFGTRLAPLTDSMPKPMLPIAGESAFLRNLKMLRANGFTSTAVTTMYLPEKIEATEFSEGNVEYFREEKPLGSAGAIAKIYDKADEVILVLSGDAICDYDLAETKKRFLESGCDAGIILCRTGDAGEYGSVCIYKGKVTEFCEKPSVRDTLSDLINTGIYFIKKKVLEMIPKDKKSDFARDLFPAMLKAGMPIAGIEPMGHWFDIGSFGDYHRCNMWVSGGESCIGKKTNIHPNARIQHCVIMDNCTVGNSTLRGCILGENAVIGNDCIVPPGCVIGFGAELRDNASLAPGTVVGTGETVVGDSYIDTFPRPKRNLIIEDDCIIAEEDEGYFVRLGRLLGGEGNVIAFAEGNGMTLPQACEIACGASEAGSVCTVISGGNDAIAAFAASEYRSRTAFISQKGDRTEIRLFSPKGMPFSREELRKISAKKPEKGEKAGSVFLLPHGALIKRYLFHLKARAFMPKKINIAESKENQRLKECAEELGIAKDNSGGAEYSVSEDGEKATAKLPDGREISYWQLIAACCIEGKRELITLPRDTPDAVEQILKRNSVVVKFYGDSESDERRLAEYDRLHRDGILLALTAAGLAERSGMSLGEIIDRLPPFSVTTRTIFAEKDKMASVISKIREECGNTRCATFDFGDGRAEIIPSASGRFRIIAEAVDSETAEEISLRAIDLLEKKRSEKE